MLAFTALAGVVWLALYAAAALADGHEQLRLLAGDVLYLVPIAAAAALTARATRRTSERYRSFWILFATSNALWLTGELIRMVDELVLGNTLSFPSAADAAYLASYLVALPAIVVGFRSALQVRLWQSLIDASIIACALGFAAFEAVVKPALAGGFSLVAIASTAYPVISVLTLITITTLAFAGFRSVPPAVVLASAGFCLTASLGLVHVYLGGSTTSGSLLSLGWQGTGMLFVLAALVELRHGERPRERRALSPHLGLVPVFASLLVIVLAVAFSVRRGDPEATLSLAAYVVAALVLRLFLTAREKDRLARRLMEALEEQERLAVTDDLTGLHNRRFFEELMTIESERSSRSGSSIGLLVIDLDRFKRINDQHGHAVGDTVLRETAARLAGAVRTGDLVARYGGEEFVALLANVDEETLQEVAERCRHAIAAEPFTLGEELEIAVTTSVGGACQPHHAASLTELFRTADRALYRAKASGRNRVQIGLATDSASVLEIVARSGAHELLRGLSAQVDRRQAAEEHGRAMAVWAKVVARELGLDREIERRCVIAAQLHDIGKVAVPESILLKAGPLTDEEWEVIRTHPGQGAWLVSLVPELREVAPIILDHHERPDGSGYPGRKSQDEISIEARIVAVCDAWAAMRARRPYSGARTPQQARSELRLCAGTQFDPDVVDAFLAREESEQERFEPPLTLPPWALPATTAASAA